MDNVELEAKFWLPSLTEIQWRVKTLGATLHSPRKLERNLRFDTPEGTLTLNGEVLRLRQTERNTLTYKRPGESYEVRREWEIEVDDHEVAQGLLEGLGYQLIHCYERYREVFQLGDCLVMLDEVPYACFVEIEGLNLNSIRATCNRLSLNWQQRIQRTYLEMFQTLINSLEVKPDQATFAAFANLPQVDASLLNLPRGDQFAGEEAQKE
jgi:adenylate cyclase class 2